MRMEITDEEVTVTSSDSTYQFEREENDRVNPVDDAVPDEVITEVENRGFFVREYPESFTWRFSAALYSREEVLFDIPEDVIQPDSTEHDSLYNLLTGDCGGIRVEITVGEDGLCRITGIEDDLPLVGSVRD